MAFSTFKDLVSVEVDGSSSDEYCIYDNDLRKSNTLRIKRMNIEEDVIVSEELRVLERDERICNASSTRNCACNQPTKFKSGVKYNFH